MTRIRTTHTGSLHRPNSLIPMVTAHESGGRVPGFEVAVRDAVRSVVADQVATGIDIINDGEQGKRTYASYVIERLSGFEVTETAPRRMREFEAFPDFAAIYGNLDPASGTPPLPACTGPIELVDPAAVGRDIAVLAEAADAAGIDRDRVFMTAVSPGTVAHFLRNLHYATHEEYLAALARVMRDEYRAIVDAGFTLQIDSPDFAMRLFSPEADPTVEDIRKEVAMAVEAVNAATEGLPPERMRIHLCWGNMESPHVFDVPLRDIVDIVATARPAGIAVESSNPRHGHEWAVFEEYTLRDDKYLLPGVIDTTTNFVEHPELVAQRIRRYTNLLGNERVVATTDCGFGTHAGRNRVAQDVAWAKLRSMVEGAQLASN